MQKDHFSQSNVYKRMIETAAEVWNVRESELTSLDPTFKLLLNALAKEVEGIGQEIRGAEARILKRLARQLMPYALQSVVPAHSVIHLTPSEKIELTSFDHFQYDKRWHNKEKFNRQETKEINFTAAAHVKLVPAKLRFRLSQNRVCETEGIHQDLLDYASFVRDSRTVVLGLSGIFSERISLYFDWFKDIDKKEYFRQLEKLRVTLLDGTPLKTEPGLARENKTPAKYTDKLDPMTQIEDLVINYYENRFVQLDLRKFQKESSNIGIPESHQSLINELDPDGECTWLMLHLPEDVEEQFIPDMFIQINCFPVINRKLERQVFRLQPDLNIKRLDFEGAFLDIERVESADGIAFTEVKNIAGDIKKPGTYSVRRGNVGRIDEREASEYLRYMIDLIKEEKQAFASLDASSTTMDLKLIEQAISRVEKRVETSGLRNTSPYIMLTPVTEYENVYIYFWSTNASFANKISRDSEVECRTVGISISGKAYILSDVTGGENELSDSMLITTYQNALLTKGAIVTKADLISHCYTTGGGLIDRVKIEKEIIPSNQSKTGLMQVLAIQIHFRDDDIDADKKNYILQRLESQILSKSNFSIPLKVSETRG